MRLRPWEPHERRTGRAATIRVLLAEGEEMMREALSGVLARRPDSEPRSGAP